MLGNRLELWYIRVPDKYLQILVRMKKLEQLVTNLIEKYNQVLEVEGIKRKYVLDIRERNRFVNWYDPKDESNKPKKVPQYYATLCLLLIEEDDSGKKKDYLLWRQEYVFLNLHEKRRDLQWRERLCMGLLYESLGVFSAIARSEVDRKMNEDAEIYDIHIDMYVPLNVNSDGSNTEEHNTEGNNRNTGKNWIPTN